MPRSAAQCHRAASVPPLGLLLPLRPAITRAALFGVWALFCALCAASRLCLVRGVRRDAQPRALRAAGLRGSSSSAPMQDFARVRLLCGAVTSATLSTRRTALAVRRLSHSPPLSLRFAPLRPLRGLASRPVLPRPHRGIGAPPTYTAARRSAGLFVLRAASAYTAAADKVEPSTEDAAKIMTGYQDYNYRRRDDITATAGYFERPTPPSRVCEGLRPAARPRP